MDIKKLKTETPIRQVQMGLLLNYYNEINSWNRQSSFLIEANKGIIKKFIDNHGKQVEALIAELRILNAKYYKTTEDGVMILSPDKKPIAKETANIDEYNAILKDMLDKTVEFKL